KATIGIRLRPRLRQSDHTAQGANRQASGSEVGASSAIALRATSRLGRSSVQMSAKKHANVRYQCRFARFAAAALEAAGSTTRESPRATRKIGDEIATRLASMTKRAHSATTNDASIAVTHAASASGKSETIAAPSLGAEFMYPL